MGEFWRYIKFNYFENSHIDCSIKLSFAASAPAVPLPATVMQEGYVFVVCLYELAMFI